MTSDTQVERLIEDSLGLREQSRRALAAGEVLRAQTRRLLAESDLALFYARLVVGSLPPQLGCRKPAGPF